MADFGLSNFVSSEVDKETTSRMPNELCVTQCGSPAYAAPELLSNNKYGSKVDIWSIGVNMFAMLTGNLPFTVQPFTIKALYAKMIAGDMNALPDYLSNNCLDMLRCFLTADPTQRITLQQAMQHPWICGKRGKPMEAAPFPNRLRAIDLSQSILVHMAHELQFQLGDVIRAVTSNTASSAMATYQLLQRRLSRHNQLQRHLSTDVQITSFISDDTVHTGHPPPPPLKQVFQQQQQQQQSAPCDQVLPSSPRLNVLLSYDNDTSPQDHIRDIVSNKMIATDGEHVANTTDNVFEQAEPCDDIVTKSCDDRVAMVTHRTVDVANDNSDDDTIEQQRVDDDVRIDDTEQATSAREDIVLIPDAMLPCDNGDGSLPARCDSPMTETNDVNMNSIATPQTNHVPDTPQQQQQHDEQTLQQKGCVLPGARRNVYRTNSRRRCELTPAVRRCVVTDKSAGVENDMRQQQTPAFTRRHVINLDSLTPRPAVDAAGTRPARANVQQQQQPVGGSGTGKGRWQRQQTTYQLTPRALRTARTDISAAARLTTRREQTFAHDNFLAATGKKLLDGSATSRNGETCRVVELKLNAANNATSRRHQQRITTGSNGLSVQCSDSTDHSSVGIVLPQLTHR